MIGVPGVWLQMASASHRPRWRATLLTASGAPLADPLPVIGGTIGREERGKPRTEAEVYIPPPAQWQLIDQSYLPTGNRLLIEYTIEGDGLGNWVTMADLDVVDSAISRPDGQWTLFAVDRSARIDADDLVRTDYPQFGGDTVANTVQMLVHRTFPGTEVLATGPALTQLVPTKYGGDATSGSPWDLCMALCAEAQSEVFYDTARRVQIRPVPQARPVPHDTLDAGPAGTVVAYTVKHEMSVNTVVLRYMNRRTGQLLRLAVAEDRRATSPNAIQRVGSHIVAGDVLDTDDAPSQAEADAAAAALLTRQGKPRSAELQHLARPWIEPGDTVQATFLGGPTERQVVESVGIDLGPGGLQTTRLRNHDYQMTTEVP